MYTYSHTGGYPTASCGSHGAEGLTRSRWCGLGEDYCTAPDCQLNYGSGCDGNQKPSGTDTSQIARPKLGRIQYGGVGIYDCVVNGDIALTFDDGPYDYTADLLDKLAVRGQGLLRSGEGY